MKKLLMAIIWFPFCCGWCYAAEPNYNMELTATNLEITSSGDSLHFTATANSNAITLSLPNVKQAEYGEYWATNAEDGSLHYPIVGTFVEMACVGEGVYSYSEEHQSDMLVAYIIVADINMTIKITMYAQNADVEAEEVIVENMTKTTMGSGRYAMLLLTGEHATYGSVQVYLDQYKEGQYGTYNIYMAYLGDIEMSGSGTWSKQDDIEILEALLQSKDGSKSVQLIGSTAPATDTAVENVALGITSKKIFQNGQILILKNGTTYSVLGCIL